MELRVFYNPSLRDSRSKGKGKGISGVKAAQGSGLVPKFLPPSFSNPWHSGCYEPFYISFTKRDLLSRNAPISVKLEGEAGHI